MEEVAMEAIAVLWVMPKTIPRMQRLLTDVRHWSVRGMRYSKLILRASELGFMHTLTVSNFFIVPNRFLIEHGL
jgi:hypothetical protein